MIAERKLTSKELRRREEIAKDLPDSEFKKRYGAEWKSVKMATATNMAKNEEVKMNETKKLLLGIGLKEDQGDFNLAAAEAAIGLAIIVVYYRNSGTIRVEEIDKLKG